MKFLDRKEELRNTIDWRMTFPDFMFRSQDFAFAYFFETPWTGRRDIGAELDRLLIQGIADGGVVSVEHQNDGTFDEARASVSTWAVDEGALFSDRRVREYLASGPTWPGLTAAAGQSHEWVLYENPAEPFGVLVTKRSLADLCPDPETVFSVGRMLELVKRPTMGFHDWVPERAALSYGAMV